MSGIANGNCNKKMNDNGNCSNDVINYNIGNFLPNCYPFHAVGTTTQRQGHAPDNTRTHDGNSVHNTYTNTQPVSTREVCRLLVCLQWVMIQMMCILILLVLFVWCFVNENFSWDEKTWIVCCFVYFVHFVHFVHFVCCE